MSLMTRTRFEVVPLTKHIGAELRGIDWAPDRVDRAIRHGRLGRRRGAGGLWRGACRDRPTRQR